jgi:ubiquinone/menaquinone biosynthesis C-methylase UbiE
MVDVHANFGAGSIPEYYDSILGPAQLERLAANLVQRLPSQPPGDVLEVACGTGIVTRKMREKLSPAVRLAATDLSKAMLDYARHKLRTQAGIDWQEADAMALPFEDASFAAVVCSLGVMFAPDKAKAFREARRVLRPGGLFLFSVWDTLEHNPHPRASHAVLRALFPDDPEMNFVAPYAFNDETLIRRLLSEAGFSRIEFEKTKLDVESPRAREFANGVVRGTPRVALLQQRGASIDEVVDKLAAEFVRIGGDKPFRTTSQAIIIQARAA